MPAPTGIEVAGFFLLALVVIGLAGAATFLAVRIWQRRPRPPRVWRPARGATKKPGADWLAADPPTWDWGAAERLLASRQGPRRG